MKLVCVNNINKYKRKLNPLEIGKVYDMAVPSSNHINQWDDIYTYIYIMIDNNPLSYPKSMFIPLEEYRQTRLKLIYE